MKTIFTTIFTIFTVAMLLVLAACSSNSTGPDNPIAATDSVIIVGTSIADDFLQTGQLGLTAIPLDEQGGAILSNEISVSIAITDPPNVNVSIGIDTINAPSNQPVAVTVNIDGSGSMSSTDPQRLRVSGAQKFVDVLVDAGRTYEMATFSYRGQPDFVKFFNTQLLHDFSADAAMLQNSFNLVRQSGRTPTYESLLEVITYLDTLKVASQYERSVVLFSDGAPNSTALKDSVCNLANRLKIPIYSIGLGPASDIGGTPSSVAIRNMREIANCSGGAYAGISANNDSTVTAIFSNIATATAKGNVQFGATLSGPGFDALTNGSRVAGTLTVSSAGGTAAATFELTVF